MVGYSGTPLPQKLGVKPTSRVRLVSAPPGFDVGGVAVSRGMADVIVAFFSSRAALTKRFEALRKALVPSGGLWIAWPKKASGVATDLDENVVRAVGLDAGLVDNKVCAIDETWSGLRFVVRLADR